jgi:hypothetical protein
LREQVLPRRDESGNVILGSFVNERGDEFTDFDVIAISSPFTSTDPKVSFTAGAITSNQTNELIVTSYRETSLTGDSTLGGRIRIVTSASGGGEPGGAGGGEVGGGGGELGGGGGELGGRDNGNSGVDRPIAAQNQLINQPSKKDVCQPTNTSPTVEQTPQQAGVISNVPTLSTANACKQTTQDNNSLRIIPDNRIPTNLNPVPQSEINRN